VGHNEEEVQGRSTFFATFTDDYSKLLVTMPIAKKRHVVGVVRNIIARMDLRSGKI
jgi:hypothetical protein